jgi:hypothetical protein
MLISRVRARHSCRFTRVQQPPSTHTSIRSRWFSRLVCFVSANEINVLSCPARIIRGLRLSDRARYSFISGH